MSFLDIFNRGGDKSATTSAPRVQTFTPADVKSVPVARHETFRIETIRDTSGLPVKEIKTSEAPKPEAKLYEVEFKSGNCPPFTAQLCDYIWSKGGIVPLSAKDAKYLKEEIQAIIDLRKMKAKYSEDAILQQARQEREAYRKLLQEGKFDEAEALDGSQNKDREQDLAEHYRAKRTATHGEAKRRSEALAPIIDGIASKLSEAARIVHDKRADEEAAECASLGLPYRPSQITLAIGLISWQSKRLMPSGAGGIAEQLARVGVKL